MEFGAIGIEQACHHVMQAVCELCQERRNGLFAHDPLRRFSMTGDLFAPELAPWSAGFHRHDRTKFVKNQYEFASDFNFVGNRCEKATVTVNKVMNSGHTWLQSGRGPSGGLPPYLRLATPPQNPPYLRSSQACAACTDLAACEQN
jgi:hypothetical protein